MHDNNNNDLKDSTKTDSEKLRLLADWFDMKYPNDKNLEVQNDLRRIADNLGTK